MGLLKRTIEIPGIGYGRIILATDRSFRVRRALLSITSLPGSLQQPASMAKPGWLVQSTTGPSGSPGTFSKEAS